MAVRIRQTGMLLIISGPAGAGKGTLVGKLMESDPSFRFSCSVTTRAPRPGEIDGVHYHFMSEEQYAKLVEEGAFLEHAAVHGHHYGTLKKPVEEMMRQGLNVLLDIDTQGAANVMATADDYVSVFIMPPSYEDLELRLRGRNTEREEEIIRRLSNARGEIEKAGQYQYVVVNDTVELAFDKLEAIVTAEKLRTNRCQTTLE